MKTIISILTKISQDLARIADSLQSKNLNYSNNIYSATKTSNPTNATITKFSTFTSSRTPQDEAINRIYDAVTNKGTNPKHHDKMMQKLRIQWPTLHSAITALVIAKLDSEKHSKLNKKWTTENDQF